MTEQQQIRDELRPILEELHNVLFSDKYFSDGELHPIKDELFNDLYDVYKKYVKVYDNCGFRAFGDEPRYTDCLDSM